MNIRIYINAWTPAFDDNFDAELQSVLSIAHKKLVLGYNKHPGRLSTIYVSEPLMDTNGKTVGSVTLEGS